MAGMNRIKKSGPIAQKSSFGRSKQASRQPMIVFLDTEFTDLLRPQLLSLGLVALDGRCSMRNWVLLRTVVLH
jgi:hypothetical protein